MFLKILGVCERNGFLRKSLPKIPLPPNLPNEDDFKNSLMIGPIGSLLLNSLKLEWLNFMVNHKDLPIFQSCYTFEDSYEYVRSLCLEKAPFGIADSFLLQNKIAGYDENKRDFFEFFNIKDCMRSTIFVNPSESLHTFHQWQRYRRVWWRKFSPTPGRYFTSDAIKNEDGSETVQIYAKYPWGTQVVELITLYSNKHPLLNQEDKLQENRLVGRKRELSHYITCISPLSTMFFNTICDSFEELDFQDRKRISLRLHRKLAPYKIAFAITVNKSPEILQELKDLGDYVAKKLRFINITSLLLPSASKFYLEKQFVQYDEMGVPFTVILDDNTLKTGVINLRSRDTTLKEEVLVKELPEYVDLLFKNY